MIVYCYHHHLYVYMQIIPNRHFDALLTAVLVPTLPWYIFTPNLQLSFLSSALEELFMIWSNQTHFWDFRSAQL